MPSALVFCAPAGLGWALPLWLAFIIFMIRGRSFSADRLPFKISPRPPVWPSDCGDSPNALSSGERLSKLPLPPLDAIIKVMRRGKIFVITSPLLTLY